MIASQQLLLTINNILAILSIVSTTGLAHEYLLLSGSSLVTSACCTSTPGTMVTAVAVQKINIYSSYIVIFVTTHSKLLTIQLAIQLYNSYIRSYIVRLRNTKLTLEEVATDLFYWKASTYLLIVDYYSRYIEISKLNGQSSEIISHKINLCQAWVLQEVVSDNRLPYSSCEYKQFAAKYGFTHTTSSSCYLLK